VFDLGGGSTQIVFEPTFDNTPSQKMVEGDHKYDLDFGGRHFSLYQHSHLMFGLNEARKKIDELLVANHIKQTGPLDQSRPISIVNPCLPPGTTLANHDVLAMDGTTTSNGPGKKKIKVDMVAPTVHSELQCRALAEQILNKESDCLQEPCSFNGVHQPSLVSNFLRDGQIYIFSYFYDRTFPLGMPSSFSLDELKDLTSQVCKGSEVYDSFAAFPGAVEQLRENPQWCQELNYMVALLHTGYDIPGHREVRIAKKIKNNELGWCLGASLPLLDQGSGWSCKIKQL
jgi:guanosine-diphosphatase